MTAALSHKIKQISFLSIIMVVFLHAYNLDTKQSGVVLHLPKGYNWFIQQYISNGLTRIAVPVFFLISGFLFFNRREGASIDFAQKIKKRFKTLVIPYLLWVVFGILFYFTLQSFPQSKPFFTKKLIVEYTFSDWLNAVFVSPIPYQFWFIRDLALMVLLSPLIYFLIRKARLAVIVVVSAFWAFNQDAVFLTSEALLFFSVGAYTSLYSPHWATTRHPGKKWILLFSCWQLVVVFKTVLLLHQRASDWNVVLWHKLSILLGIMSIWTFLDQWSGQPNRKTTAILEYSFFIFAFHEPFLTLVKKGLFYFTKKTQADYLLIYFSAPVIAILVSLALGILLKKLSPQFYAILTGNR